jgi:hypothetical protein
MTAYSAWLARVGKDFEERTGLHLDDMPDYTDLGSLYAENVTVRDAANAVMIDLGITEINCTHDHIDLDNLPGVQGYYPY